MRCWIWLLVSLSLLVACAPARLATPAPPTPTALPAAVLTETPFPTPTLTPTSTPTPGPPSLALTAPRWLGRGQMVDAAFAPDGSAVAIGWASGLSLWSVAEAQERWWHPTEVPVIAVDVHPRGVAVAAALVDGRILVLDAASGEATQFEGARPNVHRGDIAWSPDGTRIAFQFIGPGRGDPVYVLDVQTGTVNTVPGSQVHEGALPVLVWSSDGTAISVASLGRRCGRIVAVATGETRLSLHTPDGGCYAAYGMAWAPDGKLLAVADPEGGVALLDPDTGRRVRRLAGDVLAFPATYPGSTLFFSPDGRWLASRGGIGIYAEAFPLIVWKVETGERVAQLGQRGDAYAQGLGNRNRVASAFAPRTEKNTDASSSASLVRVPFRPWVLSLYENGELTRWAFTAGLEEAVIRRVAVIVARPPLVWSANGQRVAAPNRYGGVAVWDVDTGALVAPFDAPLEAPALSPDGRRIALTDRKAQRLAVYDLDTGQLVQALPDATSQPLATAFSPDGTQVAYGSRNRVVVANVASGERVAVLEGYPEDQVITRVIWAPDGEALVAASGDPLTDAPGLLILWERRADGAFEAVFHTRTVRADYEGEPLARFNPTGNLVALEEMPRPEAGQLKTLVYDRDARQVIRTLPEYELAAWVSDEVLLTAEAQGWTRLTQWNARTGEKVVGQGRELGDNVYAPGGRFYAQPISSGRGVKVRGWATGEVVAKGYHRSDVLRIAWSPDGRWLASLGVDGTIRVWEVKARWRSFTARLLRVR